MPLIQWIMQNLQQIFPSIMIGGSSVVSVQYQIVMTNGVVIVGTAKNILTQTTCEFQLCNKGFFCKSKDDCFCSSTRMIPPRNGQTSTLRNLTALLPSLVQCGRPDVKSILKQFNNSLAQTPYFLNTSDFPFIAR
jgi:hypothetical protein